MPKRRSEHPDLRKESGYDGLPPPPQTHGPKAPINRVGAQPSGNRGKRFHDACRRRRM